MSTLSLFRLDGKVALITGATSGIGVSMAIALAEAFVKQVIFVHRQSKDPSELIKLLYLKAAEAGNDGFVVTPICQDLAIVPIDSIESKIVNVAYEKSVTKQIDILINNAGISEVMPFETYDKKTYDEVLHVNLHVPTRITQLVGKQMLDNKIKGKILFTCSVNSFAGGYQVSPYTVSKGALKSLVQALSNEWAGKGINVNGLAPGVIVTNMTASISKSKEKQEKSILRIPIGHLGVPDDFKGITIFLTSRASDYVTGDIIPVDGGWMSR